MKLRPKIPLFVSQIFIVINQILLNQKKLMLIYQHF